MNDDEVDDVSDGMFFSENEEAPEHRSDEDVPEHRSDEDLSERGVDSDGEDPVQRNKYEVALVVAEFHEDPRVRHDTYFESDDEREDESSGENRRYSTRSDGHLYEGQKFFNSIAVKETVLHHVMKNQRNIRQERYDKKKISFICLGRGINDTRCRWRLYCSVRKGSETWKIRKYQDHHLCKKSGECSLLKVSAIARLYLDKIRDKPGLWKPIEIEESVFDDWGISVTRNQTQAARLKALKWIDAEYDDQFKRLNDYANEILVSNPGSTVEIECYKNELGEDVFEKFYVCFEALRNAWKNTCRPLLGFDGTFLKSRVKGQLLVALGRDGDNKIYPVAWGVVGVENTDNWKCFVKKVQADLGLGDGEGTVIVYDRQKGLIKAVSDELPRVEYRHCVRHIYTNLKSKFGKRDPMKKFIWHFAWSYNEAEYDERLHDVKNFDDEVYAWVIANDPKSWCRVFYKIGPHCEDVENNSTESFNKTIVKAREKPFVPMLETVRTLAMTHIARRCKDSQDREEEVTPYAAALLREEEKLAKACTVKSSTGGMFQASISGCSHCVSLDRGTCMCGKWQIRGIPCEHAYGVILHKKLKVDDFVSRWFHTEI